MWDKQAMERSNSKAVNRPDFIQPVYVKLFKSSFKENENQDSWASIVSYSLRSKHKSFIPLFTSWNINQRIL